MIRFCEASIEALIDKNGYDCACGRHHQMKMDAIKIGSGANASVPEGLAAMGCKRPYIVCDVNTKAAAWDLVNPAPQLLADPIHLPINIFVAVRIHITNLHAHQVVQNLIALSRSNSPLLQNQNAVHPHPQRAGRSQHRMIALRLTGCHDKIIPLRLCLMQQIFKLSDLVAAKGHAAQIIPFDPDIDAQLPADVRQSVQRRREQPQGLFFIIDHRFSPPVCFRFTMPCGTVTARAVLQQSLSSFYCTLSRL